MMEEIWKDIDGYEGLYQVSNLGKIKSLDRKVWNYTKKGRILKTYNNGHGYNNVILHSKDKSEKHYYVHILVAKAFLKNPNNYNQVNHKDFNKDNNCVDNLEWVTREQNRKHYRMSNFCRKVESKRCEKISNKTIDFILKNKRKILDFYDRGYTIYGISQILNVGETRIRWVLKIFDRI